MSNDSEKITLNIPVYEILLVLGVISIIVGILAPFQLIEIFGIEIFFDSDLTYIGIPLGVGLICGYITRKILPNDKKAYFLGLFLGIIGIIVAVCIRPKNNTSNNSNKYEELQKLAELKQNGILTEEEFKQQKEKILK